MPALFIAVLPGLAQEDLITPNTALSSEAPTLRFEQISLQEGMLQSSGNTIMQDSQGYMWISTQGGLHRYDGYEFKVYNSTPFDTTSLSDSWVWAAAEAENGDIWVTTQGGGLNRLDPVTGKAVHYRHDPDDSATISSDRPFFPLVASNGDLWVSTFSRGLNRMRVGEEGKFERFSHDAENPNSISSNVTFWMSEDNRGNIWAGSGNGVNRIDPTTGEVTRFLYTPELSRGYGAPENVLGIYAPPSNQEALWLATGNGLVKLNSGTGEHQRFLIEPNEGGVNPMNFIHKVAPDPNDNNVLWVAGPGTGVARFDMRNEEFTSYRNDPRDPNSLSDNQVVATYVDRTGMMWLGTATEGVNVFNPGAVNFRNVRHDPENPSSLAPGIVWGIYEDQQGTLWVGSDEGSGGNHLTQFDGSTKEVKKHRFDPENPNSLLNGSYRSFAEDGMGQFWVAGTGGLSRFDRKSGHVTRFRHENRRNRQRNIVFSLITDNRDPNFLWVGSAGGLDRFDIETEEYTSIRLNPDTSVVDHTVYSIWNDGNGALWLGSDNGLYKVDAEEHIELISSYDPKDTTQISDNSIYSIVERSREPGILWLACTNGGGLNRFDTKTGVATHFTKEDGLPDNVIYGILEDDDGTLWMSTNGGLCNFNPDTYQIRNYGLDDGLMALEYSQNAYEKGAGGVLYFGSGEGFTAFEPAYLNTNSVPPQVAIADFKLFNQSVLPGSDSPLDKPLSKNPTINLDYDQNEISFDFVALHFGNPSRNKYAYQLEGFDEGWINSGTQRTATYTNLPPGDYTFRVKASNADGVWNETGASVVLSISPPWYRTIWAYFLFASILALTVFGVDRFQRYRISIKEEERAALREAELRAEAENKRRADTEELSKIGRAITSTFSINKIIDTVYENVNSLMDAAIFGVGIYNEKKKCLDFPATKEEGEMLSPYSNRLDDENWLSVHCFKNGEEIVIADFENEYSKYLKSVSKPIAGKSPASIIYLPLIQQDKVIGVITTQSFTKDAYSEYHVNLLRNLANYAAIAIDNASAYRKLNTTIGELQSTQEQLIQSEKMASLGELTAGIAHEIQNPLNFVNNFSDINGELIEELKEELAKGNKEEALLIANDLQENENKIVHHGKRAEEIVRSMLQHSRGSEGVKEVTDINAVCDEYLRLAYHGLRAKDKSFNAEFTFNPDEKLPQAEVVPQDIGRVLLYLINNAFQAVNERRLHEKNGYQPEVIVSTKLSKKHIEISIKDNGGGIPDRVRDKIFQPFFTTKPAGTGTGLGLSMSYDIITKGHGGDLKLETVEGEGTQFFVTLPISTVHEVN